MLFYSLLFPANVYFEYTPKISNESCIIIDKLYEINNMQRLADCYKVQLCRLTC